MASNGGDASSAFTHKAKLMLFSRTDYYLLEDSVATKSRGTGASPSSVKPAGQGRLC